MTGLPCLCASRPTQQWECLTNASYPKSVYSGFWNLHSPPSLRLLAGHSPTRCVSTCKPSSSAIAPTGQSKCSDSSQIRNSSTASLRSRQDTFRPGVSLLEQETPTRRREAFAGRRMSRGPGRSAAGDPRASPRCQSMLVQVKSLQPGRGLPR